VLSNYLSLVGYRVTTATSGQKALDLAQATPFDLILLDVMMPHLSGYDVCQRLRDRYPLQQLPIVMLTAKNQVVDLVTAFERGANDYLTKPFIKAELLARIRTHLQLAKTACSYQRFVPYEYLNFLGKESILDVHLGDHISKTMAVMFSDIRDFTTLSETMTPQENFNFVNSYLEKVAPIIREHGGFVIKYLGDGIMAVFPDSIEAALQAGIAKLEKVEDYNQDRRRHGYRPIQIGVCVHQGPMMVGMVGESNRIQGDAFSDHVNLASRLEGLTRVYGSRLLISEAAYLQLADPRRYCIRYLDRVLVQGRQEPVAVYEVLDGDTAESRQAKLETQSTFTAAITYYQQGQWQQAIAAFQALLASYRDDQAAQIYLKRSRYLQQHPPDAWDGIWQFEHK
jgi:two-component system sensor histidine kinase ChiS